MKSGSIANNSEMKLPTHTGTHVNAPGHVFDHYFDADFDVDTLDFVVAHAEAGVEESGSAEEAFMWELFGTFKYFFNSCLDYSTGYCSHMDWVVSIYSIRGVCALKQRQSRKCWRWQLVTDRPVQW